MSDPNNIFVNYGQTQTVYDALQAANNAIQGVLDDLQGTISGLQATWSGASNDEYTSCQTRWNGDMANMQALLPKYASTLMNMTDNYSLTDNRIAGQWQGIN
jgi:WXG100 family type VII secretion target